MWLVLQTHKGFAGTIEHRLRKGAASCKHFPYTLSQVSVMQASDILCDFSCYLSTLAMPLISWRGVALACSGMSCLNMQF